MVNWEQIHCPLCGEQRKNTDKNKVIFDPKLSDKTKGKMVFMCINLNPKFHSTRIHFIVEVFEVKVDISSVRIYVIHDKRPNFKQSKKQTPANF